MARLEGYGAQYLSIHAERYQRARERMRVVADRTPTLDAELTPFDVTIPADEAGYARLEGLLFPAMVVLLDRTGELEPDDLLASFGHRTVAEQQTQRWWEEHRMATGDGTNLKQLEAYDEALDKFLRSLPLERRLAGLDPAQILLALPDTLLAALSEEILASLPEQVRARIRMRLGRR